MKIYYNPKLKEKARKLQTISLFLKSVVEEAKKTAVGISIYRQKPIDEYIADFLAIA